MKRAAHILYLVGVEEDKKASAIKGVRAARQVLGDRIGSTMRRAEAAVDEAQHSERYVLGSHDDLEVVQQAGRAAETESNGVLLVEVGPNPENAASDAGASDGLSARIYKVLVDPATGEQAWPDGEPRDAVLVDDLGNLTGGTGYSWEAISHALICMVSADGGPGTALTYARTYAMHGEEDGVWHEVCELLESVFPSDPTGGAA